MSRPWAPLGEDLQASTDIGAPVHWRGVAPDAHALSLPAGISPWRISSPVPGALLRRLSQIGVVADEAACRALSGELRQGQRLVTKTAPCGAGMGSPW